MSVKIVSAPAVKECIINTELELLHHHKWSTQVATHLQAEKMTTFQAKDGSKSYLVTLLQTIQH